MDELRVEVGLKESFKKKLVRSRWAGHLEKMGDGKLAVNGGETEARKAKIAIK